MPNEITGRYVSVLELFYFFQSLLLEVYYAHGLRVLADCIMIIMEIDLPPFFPQKQKWSEKPSYTFP